LVCWVIELSISVLVGKTKLRTGSRTNFKTRIQTGLIKEPDLELGSWFINEVWNGNQNLRFIFKRKRKRLTKTKG